MPKTSRRAVTDFANLANLGPQSRNMLHSAGIATYDDLCSLGAVQAYLRVKQSGANASLNLLWALEGAITDQPWQVIAREQRTSLLMALDDAQRKA
jgi:DNA transformation protein